MVKYILASQSPRRKQLLQWAEVDFEVIVPATDESYPDHLSPADVAVYIAQQKAAAVVPMVRKEQIVIAADTIVVWKNEIIGKPKDRREAIKTLTRLSGDMHTVITGVAIRSSSRESVFSDSTAVAFHPLTPQQIEFYVDRYEPYDKAGAYAIQEWIGVVGIKSITGDFYNVMGLPVSRVLQQLSNFN